MSFDGTLDYAELHRDFSIRAAGDQQPEDFTLAIADLRIAARRNSSQRQGCALDELCQTRRESTPNLHALRGSLS